MSKVLIAALIVLSVLFAAQGLAGVGGAIFSDYISDPPLVRLIVNEREAIGSAAEVVPANAEITVAFQSNRLAATAPRIVWSSATSLIYFGVAGIIALLALAVQRSKTNSLFSKAIHELLSLSVPALVLVGLGVMTREWSQGWVAAAYDTGEGAEFSSTFETVIITLPALLVAGPIAVGFVWQQGQRLQDLSDQTI